MTARPKRYGRDVAFGSSRPDRYVVTGHCIARVRQ